MHALHPRYHRSSANIQHKDPEETTTPQDSPSPLRNKILGKVKSPKAWQCVQMSLESQRLDCSFPKNIEDKHMAALSQILDLSPSVERFESDWVTNFATKHITGKRIIALSHVVGIPSG